MNTAARKHWDYIKVCRHPDGSEWLLGHGRYGKASSLACARASDSVHGGHHICLLVACSRLGSTPTLQPDSRGCKAHL